MIAVILPSRGLIFSQVLDAVHRELQNSFKPSFINPFFTSDNLAIPDCLNVLVDQAVRHFDYLWFVEEDTVPYDGALSDMIDLIRRPENGAAACQYPLTGGTSSVIENEKGEVLFSGFGCTLVRASVLQKLKKPYFRSDYGIQLPENKWKKMPKNSYGLHDLWFFTQLRKAGYKIAKAPGVCKHLKLEALGQQEVNNGLHIIGEKATECRRNVLEIDPLNTKW